MTLMVAVTVRGTVIAIAMRVTADHESNGLVTVIVRVTTEIKMVILSVMVRAQSL